MTFMYLNVVNHYLTTHEIQRHLSKYISILIPRACKPPKPSSSNLALQPEFVLTRVSWILLFPSVPHSLQAFPLPHSLDDCPCFDTVLCLYAPMFFSSTSPYTCASPRSPLLLVLHSRFLAPILFKLHSNVASFFLLEHLLVDLPLPSLPAWARSLNLASITLIIPPCLGSLTTSAFCFPWLFYALFTY